MNLTPIVRAATVVAALLTSECINGQQLSPGGNIDPLRKLLLDLSEWQTWSYKYGLTRVHGVTASESMWKRAADISPLASIAIVARQPKPTESTLDPLTVNGFSGVTCAGFVPTSSGIIRAVSGIDIGSHKEPLAINELYLSEISTKYSEDMPVAMVIDTYLYSPPRPYLHAASLRVEFDTSPETWMAITDMPFLAPIMRVKSVSGWQNRPLFNQSEYPVTEKL